MDGRTRTLCEFGTTATFDDLPVDVVHTIKRLVLDVIGNTVGGWSASASKHAVRTVRSFGGAEQATVLVAGLRTSVPQAVFANVTMSTALEADDTLLFLGHHGQSAVLPALAVAEHQGVSGRDLLTAAALGYELGARVSAASRHIVRAPDGSLKRAATGGGQNWVIFPAVIGATKALGLGVDQMASALGIAGFAATIPTGARWNRPPWNHMKYNPYAFMAQSAINAAYLAEDGFTGDPDIFDGEVEDAKANWWHMAGVVGSQPDDLVDELGSRWLTPRASFKLWPSCRFTHGPIGLFEQIMAENDLTADDIEAVDLWSNEAVMIYQMDSPVIGGEVDCEFSLPHVIAMAALKITPGPQWVAPRYWDNPIVNSIKARVRTHVSPEAAQVMIDQLLVGRRERDPHAVEVRTTSGAVYRKSSDFTVGDPHTPETTLSDDALFTKFRGFTELNLAASAIDRCIDMVMSLEDLSDIRVLTRALH